MRPHVDSAGTAVIADPRVVCGVVGVVVDDCGVVDVVPLVHIHTIDAAVVIEMSLVPIPSLVSKSYIAEAVIDAAVVADVWSPVAAIERVVTMPAVVAPIAGGPQRALIRCFHPRSRHPVVPVLRIGPIARRPDVIVAGAIRLVVLGQRRRRVRRSIGYLFAVAGFIVILLIGICGRCPLIAICSAIVLRSAGGSRI